MSQWLPVDVHLSSHRKSILLADRLNTPHATWHLLQLWSWAWDNCKDGLVRGTEEECAIIVKRAACWTGESGALFRALVASGWLDLRPGEGVYLHAWHEHAGAHLAKLEKEAERGRRRRAEAAAARAAAASSGRPADVQRTSTRKTETEKKKKIDTEKEERIAGSPPAPPGTAAPVQGELLDTPPSAADAQRQKRPGKGKAAAPPEPVDAGWSPAPPAPEPSADGPGDPAAPSEHAQLCALVGSIFQEVRGGEAFPGWTKRQAGRTGRAVSDLLELGRLMKLEPSAFREEFGRRWRLALTHPKAFHKLDRLPDLVERWPAYGPEGTAWAEREGRSPPPAANARPAGSRANLGPTPTHQGTSYGTPGVRGLVVPP
jgi:hypothetical protein